MKKLIKQIQERMDSFTFFSNSNHMQTDEISDRLVNIGKDVLYNPPRIKSGLIKSQLLLNKIDGLLAYAVEIMSLARYNKRYAKTNAILLRTLIEIFSTMVLMNKHFLGTKNKKDQDEIAFAFDQKLIDDRYKDLNHYEEQLKKVKGGLETNSPLFEEIIKAEASIKDERKKILERKKTIPKIYNKELLNSISEKTFYATLVDGCGGKNLDDKALDYRIKRHVLLFSRLYKSCCHYTHPNCTSPEPKEVVADLFKLKGMFAIIVVQYDEIVKNLNEEDREFLLDVARDEDEV